MHLLWSWQWGWYIPSLIIIIIIIIYHEFNFVFTWSENLPYALSHTAHGLPYLTHFYSLLSSLSSPNNVFQICFSFSFYLIPKTPLRCSLSQPQRWSPTPILNLLSQPTLFSLASPLLSAWLSLTAVHGPISSTVLPLLNQPPSPMPPPGFARISPTSEPTTSSYSRLYSPSH